MPNNDAGNSVGFVGLGAMGAPMARVLSRAGKRLVLFDIDAARLRSLGDELGTTAAETLCQVGRACDLIITMLPNADAVRTAVMGEGEGDDAIVNGLSAGAVIVDMSSSYPLATRALGSALAERGIALLDAPVSGGVKKAADGTLAIMLGGDDEQALAKAAPVLECMGTVYRTGSLGTGHALKALNNYVSAAGLAAACEAVIVGKAFGLDPERMVDIMNASTGRNNSTENKLKPFILSGEFAKAGFALDLMAKDVKAAADLAEELGHPMQGLVAAKALWRDASEFLGKGADHTEIYRFLAETKRSSL